VHHDQHHRGLSPKQRRTLHRTVKRVTRQSRDTAAGRSSAYVSEGCREWGWFGNMYYWECTFVDNHPDGSWTRVSANYATDFATSTWMNLGNGWIRLA
jgi:hypothetical protein